jgi:Ni/Co efflux regulator RcnB
VIKTKRLSLALALLVISTPAACLAQAQTDSAVTQLPKIETTYDRDKNMTTVWMAPVKISGEKDKYYSLHFAPAYSYPGRLLAHQKGSTSS